MTFDPGALVRLRHRDWVVMPSPNPDLLLLKPLDGGENEITGIFKPLAFADDIPKHSRFPPPSPQDLGNFASARLLYDAGRLSLRNPAGPFRCFGKLSFRPRAYQLVPLVMALRQQHPIRLLIADDVGVGKTIEALIILKELLERGEIERFAIITPPHLCDQWQSELKDKFSIDAEVIRSNTQARLDRAIPGDTPVFKYYSHQIISIDYIKSPNQVRYKDFLNDCPELVIVDEAHTCASHDRAGKSRQQRHQLVSDLAKNKNRRLILLTATPHSGKPEQFQSLLGLIDPRYGQLDLKQADRKQRTALARHFVQRRRRDVEKWLGQQTPFPSRDSGEYNYEPSNAYTAFYRDAWRFTLGDREGTSAKIGKKMWYWSALRLLQGIMSSPAAGAAMLRNAANKTDGNKKDTESNRADNETLFRGLLLDDDTGGGDYPLNPAALNLPQSPERAEKLTGMADRLEQLKGITHDAKAARAVSLLREWLKQGFRPVVFCTFIATAQYLGQLLKEQLSNMKPAPDIQVVTGEDPDDSRRQRIAAMNAAKTKILVATDCLSEGINLQEQFNAVLHYDLPWNPNRLEQRDGRVDRYGQQSAEVKCFLLKSESNPVDETVYRVLIKKVREIHAAIGISLPFASQSILDEVFEAVSQHPGMSPHDFTPAQKKLDFGPNDPFKHLEQQVSRDLEAARKRIQQSRTIFAQHAIKAEEIEKDLAEADRAIGAPETVERFTLTAMQHLGVQMNALKNKTHSSGYRMVTDNLDHALAELLPPTPTIDVSFHSPTAQGFSYIGRNHEFTERLCRLMLAAAMDRDSHFSGDRPKRAAVMRSTQVKQATTLLLLRLRLVLRRKKKPHHELVAEEMLAWGFHGLIEDGVLLAPQEVDQLMDTVQSAPAAVDGQPLSPQSQVHLLESAIADLQDPQTGKPVLQQVARRRAQGLVDSHERFSRTVRGARYDIAANIPDPDIIGIYILIPANTEPQADLHGGAV